MKVCKYCKRPVTVYLEKKIVDHAKPICRHFLHFQKKNPDPATLTMDKPDDAHT